MAATARLFGITSATYLLDVDFDSVILGRDPPGFPGEHGRGVRMPLRSKSSLPGTEYRRVR